MTYLLTNSINFFHDIENNCNSISKNCNPLLQAIENLKEQRKNFPPDLIIKSDSILSTESYPAAEADLLYYLNNDDTSNLLSIINNYHSIIDYLGKKWEQTNKVKPLIFQDYTLSLYNSLNIALANKNEIDLDNLYNLIENCFGSALKIKKNCHELIFNCKGDEQTILAVLERSANMSAHILNYLSHMYSLLSKYIEIFKAVLANELENLTSTIEALPLHNLVSKQIINEKELMQLSYNARRVEDPVFVDNLALVMEINNDPELIDLIFKYKFYRGLSYILSALCAVDVNFQLGRISWNLFNIFAKLFREHKDVISDPQVIEIFKCKQYIDFESNNRSIAALERGTPCLIKILKAGNNILGRLKEESLEDLFFNLINQKRDLANSKEFEYFLKLTKQPEYSPSKALSVLTQAPNISTPYLDLDNKKQKEENIARASQNLAEYLDLPLKERFAKDFYTGCAVLGHKFLSLPKFYSGGRLKNLGELFTFLVKLWGKDVNFAGKLAEMYMLNDNFRDFVVQFENRTPGDKSWASKYYDLLKGINVNGQEYKIPCSNFNQLTNNWNQFIFIDRIIHNNYTSITDAEYYNIIFIFLRGKYDIKSDLVAKTIDLALDKNFFSIANLEEKAADLEIDYQQLIDDLKNLQDQFLQGRISLDKEKIYRLSNETNLIKAHSDIKDYKKYKKDKVPEIFNLNYAINENLKFEVLPNNSFEYFTVGADTGCCQRVRNAGAVACVDSYINPLAGVLTLRYDGRLIAQSYFHYVPEDNGYILDNVESNVNLVKMLQVDLDEVYASLAAQVKKDYNVNYFRCGKQYNKLSDDKFTSSSSREDKRDCLVEALGIEVPIGGGDTSSFMYSDYDGENFLDLLQPKIKTVALTSLSVAKVSQLANNFWFMLKVGL